EREDVECDPALDDDPACAADLVCCDAAHRGRVGAQGEAPVAAQVAVEDGDPFPDMHLGVADDGKAAEVGPLREGRTRETDRGHGGGQDEMEPQANTPRLVESLAVDRMRWERPRSMKKHCQPSDAYTASRSRAERGSPVTPSCIWFIT